eukprot:CAMPEP_0183370764 /NCGR_PEP_ID=MMETSP0164_2-20130417/103410_1 /TAXON_ID=221442 /ORGANISM="Coccolithus pelagicus ssp braarudi, Strain PLY182g" /LENGTH=34 /DNA_ID= /DNA_START= /DNA_END= /DNA_ORIENTATION=
MVWVPCREGGNSGAILCVNDADRRCRMNYVDVDA